MKKIKLSYDETNYLVQHGAVEIERNGFPILIERDDFCECGFRISIISLYDGICLFGNKKGTKK